MEEALDIIDKEGVEKGRDSKRWVLKDRGNEYPPKNVISVAGRRLNGGRNVDHNLFGANRAIRRLTELGCRIYDKIRDCLGQTTRGFGIRVIQNMFQYIDSYLLNSELLNRINLDAKLNLIKSGSDKP